MSLTISLYASYHICLSFLQPLPLSVFQTTTVSLYHYLGRLSFKLSLSLLQTTTVSLSMSLTISLYASHHTCLFLRTPMYLCLSFNLPLYVFQTTPVSIWPSVCLLQITSVSLSMSLTMHPSSWFTSYMSLSLTTLPLSVSLSNYFCLSI